MAGWIINRPKATITCSKCKARLNAKLFMDLLEKWNYCPYCGADMRAEQTEPQTEVETMSCAECKHRPIGAEICEEACHYEPQTDWHYDEQDATWYPYKHEDEPQTEREGE